MGYRNIKPTMIHIDSLMRYCGLFDGDTDVNNGYGCKSKNKDKQESGCCFAFDCPLAWEASLDDMKKHDPNLYDEYKEEAYDPDDVGSNWMVQFREIV